MSEHKRGRQPDSTLRLLRELTAFGEADEAGAALEHIPADWRPPDPAPASIRVAVPFSGTVPAAELPQDLRTLTHSRRADLAGVAWVYRALPPQGRAAVVVPASFLSEATQGHAHLRRRLTEEGRVQGIVRLAAGVYKPRTGAAVLVLGPTDLGPVWIGDVADPAEMPPAGPPDDTVSPIARRWHARLGETAGAPRAGPDLLVSRDEIAAARFAWAPDAYRPTATTPTPRAPHEILAELAGLEAEIFQGIRDLVGVLKR
jgi:type I restriction enzyme M protein